MFEQFPKGLGGTIRRIVTAVDDNGKSVVMREERVEGDPRALLLWGCDSPPRAGDGEPIALGGWWPPPGGVRVSLSTRAPDAAGAAPRPPGLPDIEDQAGFHASRSTDVVIVIAGCIWLELDDGVEVKLSAGDVLVQNGTRHRWRNHGADWPIIAVVIVGAAAPSPQIG